MNRHLYHSFSTPLYINPIPSNIIDPLKIHLNQEDIETNSGDPSHFGSHSKDTYLLNNPKYSNLKNYVLEESTAYADEVLNYDYIDYKLTQSWISIKNPNEEHFPHTHSNSLVSGVIFYEEPTPDTPSLFFDRDDKYTKTLLAHKHKKSYNNLFPQTLEIPYKNNLLILFPSYQLHAVEINKSNQIRKSLSFNVIPKNGFGSEDKLNELKF